MWFWVIFLAVGLIFIWSYLQQQPRKRSGSFADQTSARSPKGKKKPFFRIERVEDD